MRVRGIIKISAVLILDAIAMYAIAGPEAAALLVAGIVLFAVLGEYIDILKDRAVRTEKLTAYQRMRLQEAKADLLQDVRETVGKDISRIRFYMLPDSGTINAYAYGFRSVAVTKAALDATDKMTLNAVLSHEISHILALDAVFNRIIFANVSVIVASLGLGCTVFAMVIWLVLAIPSVFSRHGCVGVMAANGITRLMRAVTTGIQHLLVAAYQMTMGVVSRAAEYRADAFAADLGYGSSLSFFLERFIATQDSGGRQRLRDLLYSTHPEPYKRIYRLQQQTQRQLQTIL